MFMDMEAIIAMNGSPSSSSSSDVPYFIFQFHLINISNNSDHKFFVCLLVLPGYTESHHLSRFLTLINQMNVDFSLFAGACGSYSGRIVFYTGQKLNWTITNVELLCGQVNLNGIFVVFSRHLYIIDMFLLKLYPRNVFHKPQFIQSIPYRICVEVFTNWSIKPISMSFTYHNSPMLAARAGDKHFFA